MSRSKKILFIAKYFQPHIGGVENHILGLIQGLGSDYEVTVITERYDQKLPSKEVFGNIKINRISYPKYKYFGLFILWFKLVIFIPLFLKSDVIHIHDVFIWFLPFRLLFFWKKVFLTFHGWEGVYPIPKSSLIQKKLAWRLSSGSIVIGKYLEKYYQINSDFVIYGGVDTGKLVTKRKTDSIVFVGRLSADTGIPIVLKGLERSDYNEVSFCGDGDYNHDCRKVGKVLGFVRTPGSYMSVAKICIAGGYLSIIESLLNGCITLVITQNAIRKEAFIDSPFARWIHLCSSADDVRKTLHLVRINKLKRSREAFDWALGQDWKQIASIYVSLWSK